MQGFDFLIFALLFLKPVYCQQQPETEPVGPIVTPSIPPGGGGRNNGPNEDKDRTPMAIWKKGLTKGDICLEGNAIYRIQTGKNIPRRKWSILRSRGCSLIERLECWYSSNSSKSNGGKGGGGGKNSRGRGGGSTLERFGPEGGGGMLLKNVDGPNGPLLNDDNEPGRNNNGGSNNNNNGGNSGRNNDENAQQTGRCECAHSLGEGALYFKDKSFEEKGNDGQKLGRCYIPADMGLVSNCNHDVWLPYGEVNRGGKNVLRNMGHSAHFCVPNADCRAGHRYVGKRCTCKKGSRRGYGKKRGQCSLGPISKLNEEIIILFFILSLSISRLFLN